MKPFSPRWMFTDYNTRKVQIFVTSNAVIKNMFYSRVDDYNCICKQRTSMRMMLMMMM